MTKGLCAAAAAWGHLVPTIVLARGVRDAGCDVALLSDSDRTTTLLDRHQIRALPIPAQMRVAEARSLPDRFRLAYQFGSILEAERPDFTICDWSIPFFFALRFWRPECRISILRCDTFPGYRRRSILMKDKFTARKALDRRDAANVVLRERGLPQINDVRDLWAADVIVVPSVPAIDPLPAQLHDEWGKATILYTGPLLLPLGELSDPLSDWLAARRQDGTPLLLVTFGTEWGWELYGELAACFAKTGIAIVMIVPDQWRREHTGQQSDGCRSAVGHWNGAMCYITGESDVRALAERCDAVLHHCGHGTLHSVLLAKKPSLTVPSYSYDRDDNALRLEDLSCARPLPPECYRDGFSPSAMTKAVTNLLCDEAIRRGVTRMAETLEDYTIKRGPAEVVRELSRRGVLGQSAAQQAADV